MPKRKGLTAVSMQSFTLTSGGHFSDHSDRSNTRPSSSC